MTTVVSRPFTVVTTSVLEQTWGRGRRRWVAEDPPLDEEGKPL